jgi:D-alanyl-D-alanine carboxypeptidase
VPTWTDEVRKIGANCRQGLKGEGAAADGVRPIRKMPEHVGRFAALLLFVVPLGCKAKERTPDRMATVVEVPTPSSPADASVVDAPDAAVTPSFGQARVAPKAMCSGVAIADVDKRTSFVDGDDLFALVNRSPTGQLPPDWSPSDLVDIRSGKRMTANECGRALCLRADAKDALDTLLAAMKEKGFAGRVESAFRSYGAQCGTFLRWAAKGSFCDATEQSALPGHSQHQLGTTLDLFTEEWAKDPRGVFREGFGCSPAGQYLSAHATDFGFVMPYPLHPDDRNSKQSCLARWDIPVHINPKTGYRFEHWHFRFIGKDAAAAFAKAVEESGPGTPNEITLEQWLRGKKGFRGADSELPVCDGCNCGACSTLANVGESLCDRKGGALHLDGDGLVRALPVSSPHIKDAKRTTAKKWGGVVLDVRVEDLPEGLATQPPVLGLLPVFGYHENESYEAFAPFPDTAKRSFPPLPAAWTLGVEPIPNVTGSRWPWRAALASESVGETYNRANVLLPAKAGNLTVRIPLPASATSVQVVLLRGGVPVGAPTVADDS